jgi:hypothetical protein
MKETLGGAFVEPYNNDLSSAAPWQRSLRRSLERRAGARRRRLARRRRNTGLPALLIAVLALAGVALAQSGGTSAGDKQAKPGRTTFSKALKVGSRGRPVAHVQGRLRLAADGVYGHTTKRAVKRFQRRRGLDVDGIVGPVTGKALGMRWVPRSRRSAAVGTDEERATLERIAQCESGGNPRAVSADGRYRGKYQFMRSTWRRLGGEGDPAAAAEGVQDRIALKLLRAEGTSPWPACA